MSVYQLDLPEVALSKQINKKDRVCRSKAGCIVKAFDTERNIDGFGIE